MTQFEEMDVTSMPIWYSKIPDLIAELKRCYNAIDDLKWRHMQVLRERKDLRDEGLRLARKLDKLRTTEE